MNSILNRQKILDELVSRQIKNVMPELKLSYNDMIRVASNIDTSVFDENDCCFWKGYVTNKDMEYKSQYVNFFLKNKKCALHRVLYANYVGEIEVNNYLKYLCENRGRCCNINHIIKLQCPQNMYTTRTGPDPPLQPKIKPRPKRARNYKNITLEHVKKLDGMNEIENNNDDTFEIIFE